MNLNWLLASNILLSISKTTDGFDTALGVSLCPAGCDLLCILMMMCSMQEVGGYASQIYSRFFSCWVCCLLFILERLEYKA